MENFSIENLVASLTDPKQAEFPIHTELDLPYQRVINVDVLRTKSGILTDAERSTLETFLTFYCKTENLSYKQGMNEILAPFILLSRQGVPLHVCYSCFKKFVEKFIPTLFLDDSFKPLNGFFLVAKLILKYHLPELNACFNSNEITPDIYMTAWYVTMFSSKIKDIDLLYMFWFALIERDDILFIPYFGIALLEFFKNDIKCQEIASFPNVFKKIIISDLPTLRAVIQNADRIKQCTPKTSDMILRKYNFSCLDNTDTFIKGLEKHLGLPILPRDILPETYPHDMICHCSNVKTCKIKRLPSLLIDCRPSNEQKLGNFLNSQLLCKSAQKNQNKLKEFPRKFMNLKKNVHISLMGSASNLQEGSFVHSLYLSFIQFEFPYISIVDGGYTACHEFALQHGYSILSHKEKTCLICDENANKVIEHAIDRFFKIESPSKKASTAYMHPDNNEHIYRCKLSESQNMEDSELGLILSPAQMFLYNTRRKEVTEEFQISKLTKITKKNSDILSFIFEEGTSKRVFILDHSEVSKFLSQMRTYYNEIKNVNSTIKKLI